MPSKDFSRRLHREIRLRIREMRDGCVACRACRGLCHEHHEAAIDLILRPRKHIDLKARKDKEDRS